MRETVVMPDRRGWRIDRRTFLKALGLGGAGLVAAGGLGPTLRPLVTPALAQSSPVDALALALQFDPEQIFRFVADEIWYEPYPGVLRGAHGTLASGAGNDADRALLLAALLNASGLETRFVMGRLDEPAAQRILSALVIEDGRVRERARAVQTETFGPVPPPPPPEGVLPPELESILSRADGLIAAADDWIGMRIDEEVGALEAALASAGIESPTSEPALSELERGRHVWVQYARGPEWVDLDASLAGTSPGSTIAAVEGEPVQALPDELRHRIDLTISIDTLRGGTLVEEAILEHALFAADASGLPIALLHEKPDGLKSLGVSIDSALGDGGLTYLAILLAGDDAIVSSSGIRLSGSGNGVFDTGLADDREGEALAEWLDVKVTAPDGASTTSRRVLFDRLSDPIRMSGSIDVSAIPAPELVAVDEADEGTDFLPMLTLRFLSMATGATTVGSIRSLGDDTDEVMAIGSAAQRYHLARDAGAARHALDRGVRCYLDGPNLAMYSVRPLRMEAQEWQVSSEFDLIHRREATLPTSGEPAGPPGLVTGVLGHLVERMQAGDGPPELLEGDEPSAVSVGRIFEAARRDGVDLLVLRDEQVPDGADYPGVSATLLENALASGWIVIVPAQPVMLEGMPRLGWWLLDPESGRVIDQLDDGTGAVLAGYGRKLLNVARQAKPFLCLGWTLYDYYHFAHKLIELEISGALVSAMANTWLHKKVCH